MALILDKTHTGVTSVDISGNTLTTGYTNLNYTDEYGNVHDNPYMVVDNFIIDKLIYAIRVTVSIYKDSDARSNGKNPIHTEYRPIQDDMELYNKYFSIENMQNNDVFAASYNFIQSEYFQSWKSDEV